MENRSKQIFSIRFTDQGLKDHIKKVAFDSGDSANNWILKKLAKASGYPTKGKLR